MTFTHYDSGTRLFSTKEGTVSPPHSLSILIRVKQWLEKRLASIHILGLQSEAVYGHVITQFSWMGRLPHILGLQSEAVYGHVITQFSWMGRLPHLFSQLWGSEARAWSSMHSISFMCIHAPFQKKKRWRPNRFRSEYNNVNSASTIVLINAPYP